MDVDVDRYNFLGLPSGEEGAKFTEKEISKAYKQKALELHPDKRPDNPIAHVNFQRLKSSYEILKDDKARKLFDDLIRAKCERYVRASQKDSKRQKMMSHLEERERNAFAVDPVAKAREEEDMIARELQEEIARIRAMHGSKRASALSASNRQSGGKETMLKVSWKQGGEDYTAESLKELSSKFGEVEDTLIASSKKKHSALKVATKEETGSATGNVYSHLSNPLLVLPVKQVAATVSSNIHQARGSDRLDNLVGRGYKAYENFVLEKHQKAAAAKTRDQT